MKRFLALAVVASIGAAGPVVAGTFTDGNWSPSGCGVPPTPQNFDMSSRSAYKASEAPVTAFVADEQKYFQCMAEESHADMTIIKQTMDAKRTAITAQFDKIKADSHAAVEKFNGPAATGGQTAKTPAQAPAGSSTTH
jgi:hypothetical protein